MKIIFQKKNFFFSSSAKSNKTFPQVILNWINFSFHKIYTENREILSFLLLFSYLVQRKKLLTLKSLVFNEFLCRTSLSFYFIFPLEKFTVLFAINFLARQKQSEMKIKTSHKSARRFFEGKRRQPKILITNFSN